MSEKINFGSGLQNLIFELILAKKLNFLGRFFLVNFFNFLRKKQKNFKKSFFISVS